MRGRFDGGGPFLLGEWSIADAFYLGFFPLAYAAEHCRGMPLIAEKGLA